MHLPKYVTERICRFSITVVEPRRSHFRIGPAGGIFAAFIICYLPDDPGWRVKRRLNLHWQLRWWWQMTDIPVHVFASNWTQAEIDADSELVLLANHGGSFTRVPPQDLIPLKYPAREAACRDTSQSSVPTPTQAATGPAYAGAALASGGHRMA